MRRAEVSVLIAILVLVGVLQGSTGGVSASSRVSGVANKKTCKTVTKKVHGKKKRVKVCHSVKPKPTATPLAPDAMAQSLATTVTAATTDEARHAAVLKVFAAVHIGVYDAATGKPLVAGMENNPKDFFLYDGELGALITAMGQKQPHGLDELAGALTALGIKPAGKPVTPVTMGLYVQGLLKWAMANPTAPGALVPLLVRDLGEAHDPAVDLATVASPETATLDPLQLDLLTIYLLGPIAHAASQPGGAVLHTNLGVCTPIKYILNPFNPNTYLSDLAPEHQVNVVIDQMTSGVAGGVLSDMVVEMGKVAADAVGRAGDMMTLQGMVISLLHGVFLAAGLAVVSGPPTTSSTHYGPVGHATGAGTPLVFKATVVMVFDVPKAVKDCLNDAGISIPDQGPVPNVPVNWDNGNVLNVGGNHLEDYGTITFTPANGETGDGNNGPKGVSTLTFTPKDEAIPGIGPVVTVVGRIRARAMWGLAFGNPFGVVNEFITPIHGAPMDWSVALHKPRGYKFTLDVKYHTVFARTGGGGGGGSHPAPTDALLEDVYTAHICGSDPYDNGKSSGGKKWNVDFSRTQTTYYPDGYVNTSTSGDNNAEAWYLQTNNVFTAPSYPVQISAGPNGATVTMHWFPYGGFGETITPTKQDVTAPVVEDTSCPAN